MEQYGRDHGDVPDGFVRMLSSYNPQHDPTYIDEGNNEVFTVEQRAGDDSVNQLILTPNMAFEMRQKLDSWLEKHFGIPNEIQVGSLKFVVPKTEPETATAA